MEICVCLKVGIGPKLLNLVGTHDEKNEPMDGICWNGLKNRKTLDIDGV